MKAKNSNLKMKKQTTYLFLSVLCILLCFGCSMEHNEPEPPFYGTMSAITGGYLTREFIPGGPVTNSSGNYRLQGSEGATGNQVITIAVSASIFSEGSYTLQDGIIS